MCIRDSVHTLVAVVRPPEPVELVLPLVAVHQLSPRGSRPSSSQASAKTARQSEPVVLVPSLSSPLASSAVVPAPVNTACQSEPGVHALVGSRPPEPVASVPPLSPLRVSCSSITASASRRQPVDTIASVETARQPEPIVAVPLAVPSLLASSSSSTLAAVVVARQSEPVALVPPWLSLPTLSVLSLIHI